MALADYNSEKIIKGEEGEIVDALNTLLKNDTFDDIEIEENIGIIDDYEITLTKEKGEIIIESIDKATGTLKLRCKASTKEYTKDDVTINVKASGNVTKLIKPDKKEETPTNGKIEINYPVSENGTYVFRAENTEGNPIEKEIVVNNIDTLPPQAFVITAEQIDKKLVITANAEDTEATETSACSGIGRYEYFVKKSTDTNYPKTPYTHNEIEITEYGTYKIFVKAYDKAGNPKDCNEEITIEIVNPNISKYGQKVNYSANEVNDWKILYINNETNETFIITSDYLPSGKVPTTKTGITTYGTYGNYWKAAPNYVEILDEVRNSFMMSWNLNTTNANIKATSRLLDVNSWNDFVTDELKIKGGSAIGSPTLEMFLASWNEVYPDEQMTCYNARYVDGYLLRSTAAVAFSLKSHADNSLYLPHQSPIQGCKGFLLSSPVANSTGSTSLGYIYYNRNFACS